MSPQALVAKAKIFNLATGREENICSQVAEQENIEAYTINGSTALLQVVFTKAGFRFFWSKSPGSRQINLLPMKMSLTTRSVVFTSINSVVVHIEPEQRFLHSEPKLLHFKADGGLMQQEEDWFNG